MAQYKISYWRDIPSQVDAFEGEEYVRRPLSERFQALIDSAAMKLGMAGTDDYLEQWSVGPVLTREGNPKEVAEAVAQEQEARFAELRDRALGRGGDGG